MGVSLKVYSEAVDKKQELEALSNDELLGWVGKLVAEAKEKGVSVGLLGNKKFLELSSTHNYDDEDVDDKVIDQNRSRIINQALLLAKKLQEKLAQEQGGVLAIDREFGDVKAQMNAIVDDINSGRMPPFMYHRVLNVNYFDADEKESRTFLAYALPKLNRMKIFLDMLKSRLGDREFESYLATPNCIMGSDKKIDIFDLYLKDLGTSNTAERATLSTYNKGELSTFQNGERAVVQLQNVDTHQISTHKSADESHVTAFRMMLEAEKLGVEATYTKPVKDTDPSREVEITNRGSLDVFVAAKNRELKKQIDNLVKLNDQDLFNYLKENDLAAFDSKEFCNASAKDIKKVHGIRFQAKAAKRFMDNMLNNHECGRGTYHYKTNSKATCGLTIEEMVATSYWASKNKANFKEDSGPTEVGNFILLVKQLHDMLRGYDIDHGTDNPDENEYPTVVGEDSNRCQGGCVNSLSWGLKTAHTAYNPVLILRADIEREIGEIYKKLVEENLELFEEQHEVIRIWNASGKVTGEARNALKKEFEDKHNQEFVATYKGYIADREFYNVIENALDDIPIPEQFKKGFALEEMSTEELYQAIKNNKIPLLHSDSKRGIESTLNYLSSLSGKEGIIEALVERALSEDKREPSVQRVLHFLSHSNIPQAQRDVEVRNINGKSITIGDLANLNAKELDSLFTLEADVFLEESARQYKFDLFCLYVKKVGLTNEELDKRFGHYGYTPLTIASSSGDVEAVKLLMDKGADVNKTQGNNFTPLYAAILANLGHIEVIKELLKHKDIDLNKANFNGVTPISCAISNNRVDIVKLLIEKGLDINKADRNGATPLNMAAYCGNVQAANELLKEKDIDVNKPDNNDDSPLWTATCYGHVGVAKALLKHKDIDVNTVSSNGRAIINIAVTNGRTEIVNELVKHKDIDLNIGYKGGDDNPLLIAAGTIGNVEITKILLAHGISPSLTMLLANPFTSKVNSHLRSAYATCVVNSFFSPVIKIFKGIAINTVASLFSGSAEQSQR